MDSNINMPNQEFAIPGQAPQSMSKSVAITAEPAVYAKVSAITAEPAVYAKASTITANAKGITDVSSV